MTFLLDTNTCIRFLNGKSHNIRKRMTELHSEKMSLYSIVKAELFFGAFKSARPEENINKLQAFVSRFQSTPFDDTAAEHYGEIRANFEKKGRPIGPNDLLIAAIALANNQVLVAHNVREFQRVEGLLMEDWEI